METKKRYNDYSSYLSNIFPQRIQKISINAGFTCPNRDGKIGFGGCTYCNNQTFHPDYCQPEKSITEQLDEGINFFRKKYENQRYLAYFQAYTNTYDKLENLISKYEEALSHPLVVGIVIGTRPDCIDNLLLDYLERVSKTKYVMIEFGIESTNDDTLKFINRGHDFATARNAVIATSQRGIATGAHLILGLPKEDKDIILKHAQNISELPLTCIKLHQLQLIKGTKMAQQYLKNPEWFYLYSADEYIDLAIDFVERIHPKFVVERFISQSPTDLLLKPSWGLKNFEFTAKLEKRMRERDSFQGKLYMQI